jgi:hypothetical protein
MPAMIRRNRSWKSKSPNAEVRSVVPNLSYILSNIPRLHPPKPLPGSKLECILRPD